MLLILINLKKSWRHLLHPCGSTTKPQPDGDTRFPRVHLSVGFLLLPELHWKLF